MVFKRAAARTIAALPEGQAEELARIPRAVNELGESMLSELIAESAVLESQRPITLARKFPTSRSRKQGERTPETLSSPDWSRGFVRFQRHSRGMRSCHVWKVKGLHRDVGVHNFPR